MNKKSHAANRDKCKAYQAYTKKALYDKGACPRFRLHGSGARPPFFVPAFLL
ncbi:hypothetical protein AB434_3909 [Heyndrickxia coagulans]|uniref:Uncharacterized protein n=1 Tax=Heyndrickxia coagulans TaxID=1398 RepID=A0AAN0T3F8_HEYCO|nr:hypothetical protein SB48_HM08orf02125 [Heyndrickxia coagulans]AKN56314.1 hypothetical protein AB434_3909 [Heyndrickxia coagulans]